MSNLIGQSLGRYLITEQLGEGGMATVYKAIDTRLDSEVAVKVIKTENLTFGSMERTLKRFEREAKSLAQLTNPNIVKVIDYGEYEGAPYLVMVYLPGGTLKQKLGKPMPYKEAAGLLAPIARALDYAHEHNLIHRDVKPSNILLTDKGQPLLSDFGIAKVIDEDATLDLTGTRGTVGTPEYMSPEQALGRPVDNRSDIYSLGVVFYEMVTGRKPYSATTPMEVIVKQSTEALPGPRKFVPDLPVKVEQVLLKALAKDPEGRYSSMDAFAAVLEELASGTKNATSSNKLRSVTSASSEMPQKHKKIETSAAKDNPAFRLPAGWPLWLGGVGLIVLAIIAIPFIAMKLTTATTPAAITATPAETSTSLPEVAQISTATSPATAIDLATVAPIPTIENPIVAPTGRIIYAVSNNKTDDFYIVNTDGTQKTLFLQASKGTVLEPSPDGKFLAIIEADNVKRVMKVIDAQSFEEIFSYEATTGDEYNGAVWSPDGSKLAFTLEGISLYKHLHILDLGIKKIADIPSTSSTNFLWSLDSQQLAFTTFRNGDDDGEVYVVNADGRGYANISQETASYNSVVGWMENNKLAFRVGKDYEDQQIKIVDTHNLSDYSIMDPGLADWDFKLAPNFKDILIYEYFWNSSTYMVEKFNFYKAVMGDNEFKNIYQGSQEAQYSDWSPDSKYLIFGTNSDLFRVNASGDLAKLGENITLSKIWRYQVRAKLLLWSPDSKFFAFSAVESDKSDVFISDIEGNNITNLTNSPEKEIPIAWIP